MSAEHWTEERAKARYVIENAKVGTQVRVCVERCEYKCCGGGWTVRDYDRPQQYTGRLLSVLPDYDGRLGSYLLQVGNPAGKMAEVIANFVDTFHAEIVD